MYATHSTESVAFAHCSPRIVAMIRVLLNNSEAIDWCPRGSVELHFSNREVHGKIAAALYTEDKHKEALPAQDQNGKDSP